jgi:hypothetical protein
MKAVFAVAFPQQGLIYLSVLIASNKIGSGFKKLFEQVLHNPSFDSLIRRGCLGHMDTIILSC